MNYSELYVLKETLMENAKKCGQEVVDTLTLYMNAVEKQVPKQAKVFKTLEGAEVNFCPVCLTAVLEETTRYCKICGQALEIGGKN